MIAIINRNDPTNEMVMELLETFNRELRGTFPKNNDGRMDTIENATSVKGSDEGAVYISMIIVKLNHNKYIIVIVNCKIVNCRQYH